MGKCIDFSDLDKQVERIKKESEITKNIASYVLFKVNSATHLKLQKLVYYVCALYYTFEKKSMIHSDVLVPWEAWVHGPANRYLHNEYRDSGLNYYEIKYDESLNKFNLLNDEEKCFIDEVLDLFGKYDGVTLETLTHKEVPWLEARGSLNPNIPSNNLIDYETMYKYYREYISR